MISCKVLPALFFRTASGNEPVREWLKSLNREDKIIIGQDVKTVEFGWPLGMPTCRALSGRKDLWEVRSKLPRGRIARIIFFTHNSRMVLLHGFIKKTQKTPESELTVAIQRKKEYESNEQ